MNSNKPLLSIGIIFRDDIRSIEHCLKDLQPLRDAMPCELVMADTGSQDGSRAIAEKYADIVFDFPWINDFAAARNAVIEHCSADWYFSVDTDEYLSGDISDLVNFLQLGSENLYCVGSLTIRNYGTYEMDDDYLDFIAIRFAHIASGIRFTEKIHERFLTPKGDLTIRFFPGFYLKHDGYVGLGNLESGKAKRERNISLIRERMEQEPNNLLLRTEFLDSGEFELDYVEQIRSAVQLLKKKLPGWSLEGPPLLSQAIHEAEDKKLPEADEWIQLAEDLFPESMFTRIDVEFEQFARSWRNHDYEDCVQRGERYLKAMEKYRSGGYLQEQLYGTLRMGSSIQETKAEISLASACIYAGKVDRAVELLEGIKYAELTPPNVAILVSTLQELQYKTTMDTSRLINRVWDGISEEKPSPKRAELRKSLFCQVAGLTFIPENQEEERKKEGFRRPGYTLYLPLRGKCEVGTAAAILELKDPVEIESALTEVKNWNLFPIQALTVALEHNARFPLPGRPMNVEEMDGLIGRLAGDKGSFLPLVFKLTESLDVSDDQILIWNRGLVMAAVRIFSWAEDKEKKNAKKDEQTAKSAQEHQEQGMLCASIFAKTEKVFLPYCYAPSVLNKERLSALPPLHRFGFYCAQAFDALDAGDGAGYVRLLREGLESCEGMKPMVEFLLDHTPELQVKPEPSEELRTLADQIRAVLANFAPDDPAVAALKQSEAYRKVAYLIEGIEVPVVGGLPS